MQVSSGPLQELTIRVGRTMIVSRIANEFHIRVASFFRAPARTDYKGGTNPNCFPYCQRVSYKGCKFLQGPMAYPIPKNVHGTTSLLFCNFAFFRRPGNSRRFFRTPIFRVPAGTRNVAQNARCRNSLGARARDLRIAVGMGGLGC